ncbi:MAG: flagellar hook-length control protein FliK [Acidithiobacillus sp.]
MTVSTLATAYALRVVESTLSTTAASALSKMWLPGNTLSGRVLQTVNQQTLISVAGKTLAFNVPNRLSVGESVQLTYLGGDTKPAFLLVSPPNGPQTDRLALSDTAQSLRALALTSTTSNVLQNIAPLATADAPAATLAAVLQKSVSESGLFYESHLAAWTQGQWSLQSLLAEPQNASLVEAHSMTSPSAVATAEGTKWPSDLPIPAPAPTSLPAAESTVLKTSPTPVGSSAQGAAAYTQIADLTKAVLPTVNGELNSATAHVLNQQIQMLNQQQIIWSGPLWPGQNVSWILQRRDGRQDPSEPVADDSAAQQWESTLTLQMPRLGHVKAQLQLVNDSLRLVIEADQATLLSQHGRDLAQSLRQLGLHLSAPQIRSRNEPTRE